VRFAPVGLYVENGKELSSLNTSKGEGNFFLKPNGVFLINERGASVVETSEYDPNGVVLATQSGPLLLHKGKIHPAFKGQSTSRLIRNGVGVLSSDVVIFAISEDPLNFYEFATLFRDVLKCQDALYFDGVVSSLYAPELKRDDRKYELGPMIGIIHD